MKRLNPLSRCGMQSLTSCVPPRPAPRPICACVGCACLRRLSFSFLCSQAVRPSSSSCHVVSSRFGGSAWGRLHIPANGSTARGHEQAELHQARAPRGWTPRRRVLRYTGCPSRLRPSGGACFSGV